jgi:hypothetical protein
MSPREAMNDGANCGLAYTESFANFPLRIAISGKLANLNHLTCGKLGIANKFASHIISTALRVHVVHVVLMGSSEEMKRIKASPIIATVQHTEPFRDGSDQLFVNKPMRKAFLSSPKADACVAVLVGPAFPLQAILEPGIFSFQRLLDEIKRNWVCAFIGRIHLIIISCFYHLGVA